MTLVDSLDTLWLMGMKDEFEEARDWCASHLKSRLEHVGGGTSVFETTIHRSWSPHGADRLYSLIVAALPQVSFSQATLFLTFFTLFFGELVPKALGVANAEGVARAVVPSICFLAVFFSPIGRASTWLTKRVLGAFGVESGEVRAYVFQLFVAFSLPSFSLFLEEGCPSPRDLSALLLSCRRPNT